MRKIMTLIGVIIIAPFILTSCGSSDKKDKSNDSNDSVKSVEPTKKTEPKQQVAYTEFKIGNQDKAYFKMVDGGLTEITFGAHDAINVTAEFEVVKTYTKKCGKYAKEQAFVSLVALDKDGNTIKLSSTTNGEMRPEGDSEGSMFLDFLKGEKGYKAKFVFTGSISKAGSFDTDVEKTKEAAQKIAGFKVLTDK